MNNTTIYQRTAVLPFESGYYIDIYLSANLVQMSDFSEPDFRNTVVSKEFIERLVFELEFDQWNSANLLITTLNKDPEGLIYLTVVHNASPDDNI